MPVCGCIVVKENNYKSKDIECFVFPVPFDALISFFVAAIRFLIVFKL